MGDLVFDANKHVPVMAEVPKEDGEQMHDRPDIPPPSPYARGAVVTHRRTRQRAVIHCVDLITRQLRLWYPDRAHLPQKDQFDTRTGWQSFDEWEPEITFSAEEVERQKAKELFAKELESFDADGLSLVTVFCDDPDPIKALGKIRALKRSSIVRMKTEPEQPSGDALAVPAEPAATRKGSK